MDKVYYYNRNGMLKLTINEDPYYAGDAEFKNWEWAYDEQFSKYRNFRRAKVEYPLTISVVDKDKASRDALCDIFDEDIQAGKPGYIMINGWKLPCYIVAAERSLWGAALDYQIDFSIVSETSTWTRETTTSYNGISSSGSSDLGRDYTLEEGDTVSGRGYDSADTGQTALMDSYGLDIEDSSGDVLYDYTGGTNEANAYGYSILSSYTKNISLPTTGNGYKVVFYGAATNPVIYLNGDPVRVITTIASGERLEVVSNGREKTIYKLSSTGERTDYFIYRDKDYSPFLTIDKSTELSYGEIKFDFTTIESRSEPSWN